MDVEGAEGGGVPAKRQLFVGGGGGDTAGESPPVVCCPLPLLNELPSGRVAQWDRALTAMGGRLVFDAARHKDVTHGAAGGAWLGWQTGWGLAFAQS